jgi:hypothetical protein
MRLGEGLSLLIHIWEVITAMVQPIVLTARNLVLSSLKISFQCFTRSLNALLTCPTQIITPQ